MAAMASIDDVWASMQDGPPGAKAQSVASLLAQAKAEKKKKSKKQPPPSAQQSEAGARSAQQSQTQTQTQAQAQAQAQTQAPVTAVEDAKTSGVAMAAIRERIEGRDALLKIQRNVDIMTNSDDSSARKQSLGKLSSILFEEYILTDSDYSAVFREVAKPIFKRFVDPVEKCRELAFKLTQTFFENSSDLVLVLGYFIPALMQRAPAGVAFDEEMKVFVFDREAHEAYRRGKAVDRQDRGESLQSFTVVETSEEIRLLGCTVLATLIRKVCEQGAASVLHPYFFEIVIFLQSQLRDPFPETKIMACGILEFMATVDEFNTGLKFFAVGLVRAILPVLRHKHAKVRVAAVGALCACISVPDRAKLRGAGTEAIPDLVGFREENVLNVAAFYKTEVQINYLAELVQDKSVQVREKLVEMLRVLLTEIGDRYDHQTRLLPYLLDLLTDETSSVADASMRCLQICGKQYEEDHKDEIIERRQYGVDGDHRINLEKPLPRPFTERPRIGMRLYVRGNTKRFLTALVNELTNWVSQTRIKSANLLKVIVVLCEEHLTMEAHTLLPSFIKALGFAKQDGDAELHSILLEVYELMGRYVLPETYIHYILPRLIGDPAVTQFGVDSASRISVMEFLGALLSGSKSSELIPHFEALASALTDPFVISPDSALLVSSALDVALKMLTSMRGKGNATTHAHFLATGRLTNLKGTISKLFNWFLTHLNNAALCNAAMEGISSLSLLESDSGGNTHRLNTQMLFDAHTYNALKAATLNYDFSSSSTSPSNSSLAAGTTTVFHHDHSVLSLLAENPFHSVQRDPASLSGYLEFICAGMVTLSAENISGEQNYLNLNELLVSVIAPLVYSTHSVQSKVACSCILDALFQEIGQGGKSSSHKLKSAKTAILLSGIELWNDRQQALESFMVFIPRILEYFVFHSKWSQSQNLQRARLDLLAALLGVALSLSNCEEFDEEDFEERPVLNGSLLLDSFPTIVDKVFDLAKFPGNSVQNRRSSVEIVGKCFYLLVKTWYAKPEFSSLLKSFEYWESEEGNTKRAAEFLGRTRAQKQAQSGLEFLICMLDDGNDDVRLASLLALKQGVALVAPTVSTEESSSVTFEALAGRLVREAASVTNSESFVEALGETLRSLAVLSPDRLAAVLRAHLESAEHSTGTQTMSEVLDHCEVLRQFSSSSVR